MAVLKPSDILLLFCQQKQRTADREARIEQKRKEKRATRTPAVKQSGKAFYQQMIKDSDYLGEDYDVFSSWLGTTH